jgi:predicted nucleotidyltransferase
VTLSSLIRKSGDELFDHYRHTLEALGNEKGLLQRLTGISAGSLHRELKAMSEAGLLIREQQGNQVLYQADRSCSIFEELASIFRKTVGLGSELTTALEPIADRIDVAFVFGSMASGKQHAKSDLDICVLGEVELLDVVKATGSVQERLRREINPVVMSAKQFASDLANHERFAERLVAELCRDNRPADITLPLGFTRACGISDRLAVRLCLVWHAHHYTIDHRN